MCVTRCEGNWKCVTWKRLERSFSISEVRVSWKRRRSCVCKTVTDNLESKDDRLKERKREKRKEKDCIKNQGKKEKRTEVTSKCFSSREKRIHQMNSTCLESCHDLRKSRELLLRIVLSSFWLLISGNMGHHLRSTQKETLFQILTLLPWEASTSSWSSTVQSLDNLWSEG